MTTWDSWIGRSFTQRDRLTPAILRRFRATLDSHETGTIAPQAIHWVLCTPEAATAGLDADGHPKRSDDPDSFFPPVPLPRRMWASSKVEFATPISVNADIERTSTIAAISEKQGTSGKLVFVDVAHQTFADGARAVSETQTLVYRETTTAKPTPAPPLADADFSEWDFHRSISPNEALLFRFSAITFNSHRIHYDAPYAIRDEGYRGLVVHGPLMSTLLLDLAAREFGHNSLRSYSFRAQSPSFANEPLHLVGKRDGDAICLTALGGDGRICVSAEGRF